MPDWRSEYSLILVGYIVAILILGIYFIVYTLNIRRLYKAISIVALVYFFLAQLSLVLFITLPGASFMCDEVDPLEISWRNCSAKIFIINQTCLPDGSEDGRVYLQENILPIMEIVAYESHWLSKEHVTKTGRYIVIKGSDSDFELQLPAECK